jgi:hypothetical protein
VRGNGWPDLSEFAVHLTKPSAEGDAYSNLGRIVESGVLLPGPRSFGAARWLDKINDSQRCVCFSEIPLHLLQRLVERRSSYGIGFTQEFIVRSGAARLWYVDNAGPVGKGLRAFLRAKRREGDLDDPIWTFTPFIDFPGDYGEAWYHFEWEREWRVPAEISFSGEDVAFLLVPEEKHRAVRRSFTRLACPLIDPCWPLERTQRAMGRPRRWPVRAS